MHRQANYLGNDDEVDVESLNFEANNRRFSVKIERERRGNDDSFSLVLSSSESYESSIS